MKIAISVLAGVLLAGVFGIVFHPHPAGAGNFHFDISNVKPDQSKAFQKQLVEDRKTLDGFFQTNQFVKVFDGTIRVSVFSYLPPRPHSQEFEWIDGAYRGMFVIPAQRVRDNCVVTIHEMTHIYAPNQGKMLTEGFAVYVEQKIGRLDVLPTFGKTLTDNLKPIIKGLAKLRIYDSVSVPGFDPRLNGAIPHPPAGTNLAVLRYLIAGSFVQFLIEDKKYGLAKFKTLYERTPMTPFKIIDPDPDRYYEVFGKNIDDLQTEWEAWVEQSPSRDPKPSKCPPPPPGG